MKANATYRELTHLIVHSLLELIYLPGLQKCVGSRSPAIFRRLHVLISLPAGSTPVDPTSDVLSRLLQLNNPLTKIETRLPW